MSTSKAKRARTEQALREAYRRQSLPSPGAAWYQAVMKQLRQESLAGIIPFPPAELVAWRVAWAAAAAALLIAVCGFATMPTDAQIVWDMHHLASPYEWSLAMGE
jgi:hypothetical protein